jgi:hypothetical protein
MVFQLSDWELAKTPRHKIPACYEMLYGVPNFDSLGRLKQQKIVMRFGIWNVRSVCRSDPLGTILKWIWGWEGGKVWTGFLWLMAGTDCRLLWIRKWTFGFHKTRWIFLIIERLSASQEGLCFMEFDNYEDCDYTLPGVMRHTEVKLFSKWITECSIVGS